MLNTALAFSNLYTHRTQTGPMVYTLSNLFTSPSQIALKILFQAQWLEISWPLVKMPKHWTVI